MGVLLKTIIEQELGRGGLRLRKDEIDRREVVKQMGKDAPNGLLNIKLTNRQADEIRMYVREAISNIRDEVIGR